LEVAEEEPSVLASTILPAAIRQKSIRTTPRYVALAEAIQARILSGEFPEGSQLPPERELAKENGVAYHTARQAIGLLVHRGIVMRKHGFGTFAATSFSPKPLIALLCGPDLSQEQTHFYRSLVRLLIEGAKQSGLATRTYDGIFPEQQGKRSLKKSEVWKQFHEDERNYEFAGAISISLGLPVSEAYQNISDLPVATFADNSSDVDIEFDAFFKSSARFLKNCGCRNPLVIATDPKPLKCTSRELIGSGYSADPAKLFPVVATVKLPAHPPVGCLERAFFDRTIVLTQKWRKGDSPAPDGLVVTDDIGMRGVAMALLKAGINVPEDMQVVSVACEGISHHYGFPVSRYEIKIGSIADHLLSCLKSRMTGVKIVKPTLITGRLRPNVV